MGELKRHSIGEFLTKYHTHCLIETGTWKGNGLNFARRFDFKQIFSIDINKEYYLLNRERFKSDKRIEVFLGESAEKLPEMLSKVDEDSNVLFWLDAHFPELYGLKDEFSLDIIIPLQRELNAITSVRDVSRDVFIIDDLRVFQYIDEPMFENILPKNTNKNSHFIFSLLSKSHNITIDVRDQGYIIAVPK